MRLSGSLCFRLVPPKGVRIAEIGAGYGRLADLYLGYDQIILFDYSRTLLEDAVRDWGHDRRFVFVAGNLYTLPFVTGILDTLVMVRVMHHLADVPTALAQLGRPLHRHSVAVVEYANKRNLKALVRWGVRRQTWSPLTPDPVEFVRLNFDFHPDWMTEQFRRAGLAVGRQFGVSHFRLPQAKRFVSAKRLAKIDSWLFTLGGAYPLAPSVFLQAEKPQGAKRSTIGATPDELPQLLRCPSCGHEGMDWADDNLVACPGCRTRYRRHQGVWDMKEPVS